MEELHVDIASKYNQPGPSLVGYVDRYNPLIKSGLIIKNQILKNLKRKHGSIKVICNELHAVIVFLLLLDRGFDYAKKIILCGDYNYDKVMSALDILTSGDKRLLNKFESLNKYRVRTKNPKIKSCADPFVRLAHRHIKKMNNIHKRHEVFNYFKQVHVRDVLKCLDFVLKRRKLVENIEGNRYDSKQESLNTSLLLICNTNKTRDS